MTRNTFTKQERLTGKTTIDQLFASGKSFFCYPYRIAYCIVEEGQEQEFPCRILINVPKRLHKTAVSRNLIKRRIKEAYRLGKDDFYMQLDAHRIRMAILYSSKEILDYNVLESKLDEVKKSLIEKLAVDNLSN